MAFVYHTTVDPNAENNSHAYTLDMVGFNKRVLEVGCATGYFTKALHDRGCRVVGIEFDADAASVAEKWAERVVVGDLDAGTLWWELGGEQFDVITFGDVLEHLRDPLATLRAAARTLKASGFVTISVPNIAHGDVRIALLEGDFPYHETGLLDRTHVHFFTRSGIRTLIREAGLVPVETRRVIMPLFQSELGVKREGVPQATISQILKDAEAETYQFVVKAVLDNGTRTLATLSDRVNELSDRANDEVVRTALLRREMQEHEERTEDYGRLQEEREVLLEELRILRRELKQSDGMLKEARREAAERQQELEGLLNTKTLRLLAPARRLYGHIRRIGSRRPVPPEQT